MQPQHMRVLGQKKYFFQKVPITSYRSEDVKCIQFHLIRHFNSLSLIYSLHKTCISYHIKYEKTGASILLLTLPCITKSLSWIASFFSLLYTNAPPS